MKKDEGVDVVGIVVVGDKVVAAADDDEAVEGPVLLFPSVGLDGHDWRLRRKDRCRFGDVGVSKLTANTRFPVMRVEGGESGIEALAPARDPISSNRTGGVRIMSLINELYRCLTNPFP